MCIVSRLLNRDLEFEYHKRLQMLMEALLICKLISFQILNTTLTLKMIGVTLNKGRLFFHVIF